MSRMKICVKINNKISISPNSKNIVYDSVNKQKSDKLSCNFIEEP